MLQASVTYNTTEYSNSTIENVSAPLSGKYGQVIFSRKPDKFQNSVGRRFALTCIKMTELYDIFSPSFAQLVSVLSYQKIQN